MKSQLTSVGRIVYALPMAVFALFHFMSANDMAGMVPSFMPAPVVWVYLVGVALLAASISIIIQKKATLAAKLLGVMLFLFVLMIHIPAVAAGGDPMAMGGLLKDLALSGAAFFISGHMED